MVKPTELNAYLVGSISRLCDTPYEAMVLAYIASLTHNGRGYYAGEKQLAIDCRCSERQVQRAIAKLVERGYVTRQGRKAMYSTTTFVATDVVLALFPLHQSGGSDTPNRRPADDKHAPKKEETKNNTPPKSPQGEWERNERKPKNKNRALNYMHDNEAYTEESLRARGISLGEEFYDDDDAE